MAMEEDATHVETLFIIEFIIFIKKHRTNDSYFPGTLLWSLELTFIYVFKDFIVGQEGIQCDLILQFILNVFDVQENLHRSEGH